MVTKVLKPSVISYYAKLREKKKKNDMICIWVHMLTKYIVLTVVHHAHEYLAIIHNLSPQLYLVRSDIPVVTHRTRSHFFAYILAVVFLWYMICIPGTWYFVSFSSTIEFYGGGR